MTSIDAVKSMISFHDGFQPSNRYRVILPSIQLFDDIISMDAFCREVTFPGKIVDTFSFRTNQKEVKFPRGYTVDTVNMKFNETNDNMISRYFDYWQNSIVNPYDYLVEYRDSYARNVFIMKLNKKDQFTYGVLLKKAYPSNKLAVQFGDTTLSALAEQSITFEYEDFEVVDHSLTGMLNQIIGATKGNVLGIPLVNYSTIAKLADKIIN